MAEQPAHIKTLHDTESNSIYRAVSIEWLLDNTQALLEMVMHHELYQVPRLDILQAYYDAKNIGIMGRDGKMNPAKSDLRIPSGFASYITDYYVGYTMGKAVNVEYTDDDISAAIKTFNNVNDVDDLNTRIETSLSKYGRAYEMQYRNTDKEDIVQEVSSFNTFMIYDKSIANKELAGVYYVSDEEGYTIELHTANEVIYFDTAGTDDEDLTIRDQVLHNYGEITISEYTNDHSRLGDYERSVPSIDAYDGNVSDLANYMSDSQEAILLITNANAKVVAEDSEEMVKALREGSVLAMAGEYDGEKKQSTPKAEYLERTYSVEGNEHYRKVFVEDIHKFSFTPNFEGEFYTSNASSGTAILYKMFHSTHRALTKLRLFEKILRKRYRLITNILTDRNEIKDYDPKQLKITTHQNLPISYAEEIAAFIQAGGTLSQLTLLENLSFIQDATAELKRLDIEKDEEAKLRKQAFMDYDYQDPAQKAVPDDNTIGDDD